MKMPVRCLCAAIGAAMAFAGCQSIDTGIFGGSFGRNSSAMTAGGAVAGQDYIIGLKPSEAAREYFASAALSDAVSVTVTPDDDKGTGVTWTDDGGIAIPPGTTIEFVNKGCCLDPHLPAPKADEEMQFVKTSCLIPAQLQGTYKNLLRRAAEGDEDVKSNLQHLMWTLRTAGGNDAYASNLTDRQREILAECADGGSFDGYCQSLHRFDGLKRLVKAQVDQVADVLKVEVGNVTYKVTDLLDPELGKQKVAAHLGELVHMNEFLPVVQSGFNFGELEKGIYTDVKGNGTLSFKAKVANSTSEPFVFYPMDYVAQVGSGQNMQGAFFAAADSTMRQRTTMVTPEKIDSRQTPKNDDGVVDWQSLSCEERWVLLKNAVMAQLAYKDEDIVKAAVDDLIQVSLLEAGVELGINLEGLMNDFRRTAGTDRGLSVSLFKDRDGVYTIAVRGTELSDLNDLGTDVALTLGVDGNQMRFIDKVVSAIADASHHPVNVTGHSLGGYLAVRAAMSNPDKINHVYTYNAPGVDSLVFHFQSDAALESAARKITNLWHSADPIHLANESFFGGNSDWTGDKHIGRNVEFKGYAGLGDRFSQMFPVTYAFNPLREHGIDLLVERMKANMGGCR